MPLSCAGPDHHQQRVQSVAARGGLSSNVSSCLSAALALASPAARGCGQPSVSHRFRQLGGPQQLSGGRGRFHPRRHGRSVAARRPLTSSSRDPHRGGSAGADHRTRDQYHTGRSPSMGRIEAREAIRTISQTRIGQHHDNESIETSARQEHHELCAGRSSHINTRTS